MEEEPAAIPTGLVITPETVSARAFTSAFRGFHPVEVRQFLKRVGDELAAGAGREVELRRALQEALNRAAHPDLDEATVTTVLGEHAARLLGSARETSASIVDDAQKQAAAVLRDAEVRVARMRDEAEGLLARRLAEADAATEGIREAAEAGALVVAEEARVEAERVVEAAKQRGKEMVAEARDLRERMLGDLSRRRRTAQVQVEQLRAARERLLAAYDVVRRTIDEATSELSAAEPEARLAAEAVARRAGESELALPVRPDESDLPVRRPPVIAQAPAGPAAAVDDRALSPVGGPPARAETVAGAAPAPALRRLTETAPPDRPPMRPQTVADAAGRTSAPPTSTPPASTPPASLPVPPPPAPAPAPAPPRPAVLHSELSTMETPAVTVDPSPPNGNGNGNGHAPTSADKPDTLVDDLFARIRADRSTVDAPAPPAVPGEAPVPTPSSAPAGSSSPALDPVSTENALAGRDDLLDNVEAGLTRALKRVLQDEQNELLDRLRRLGPVPAAAGTVLPDPGAHLAAYRVAALPWLEQAARAGVGAASDPPPGSQAERAHPEMAGLADELGTALVGPLRDRLSRVLDDADDPAAAAESVRAAYRQWKVQQVEETARHHVVTAFGIGAFAATPDRALLQWLVDDDGHCSDCDDNALAGPTAKGQPFPTGQLHPPAHPGCRCLLVPVTAVRPPSS